MTRALVWKELREHWVVWLSMTAAAACGCAGLLALQAPGPKRDELVLGVLWFVAWGYGLICGSLLLAGESEDGTQVFLDSLTAERRLLWVVKAATGMGLLAAQMAALAFLALVLIRQGLLEERSTSGISGVLLAGGIGYAWGLFCGSFSGNVLSAIGWAVLLQVVSGLLLFPVVVLPIDTYVYNSAQGKILAIWLTAAGVAALAAGTRSRWVYCRPDQMRDRAAEPPRAVAVQPGWGTLFWLAWQQMRGFTLAMLGFAVIGSLVVALAGMLAWPLVTVFAGILCGITTFADEQQSGAFRFAGDQRYPLGRVLLVKSSVRLAAALGTAGLIVLGVAASVGLRVATASRLDPRLADLQRLSIFLSGSLLIQPVLTLTLWLVYGYAVGLLCGILFRKPLVAGVVAVGVAYPLVSVWLPSVALCGWLSSWQVLGVPAVLLAGTRLLMRPWASDRLLSRRAIGTALGAVFASVLGLGAALAYRAVEVPPAPDAIDAESFRASFPDVEKNESGRQTLAALRRFLEIERRFAAEERLVLQQRLPAPGQRVPNQPTFASYTTLANRVATRGWGAGDGKLKAWLDLMFADPWAEALAGMDVHQIGITVDPRNVVQSTLLPEVQAAREVATLLVARGLQQQADGDPDAFVDYLCSGLAMARNMRHRTIVISVLTSYGVEGVLLRGLDLWLERLDGRPDLLAGALDVLRQHVSAPPPDPELIRRAELLVSLNTFSDPRNLAGVGENSVFPGQQAEGDLLRFALQVPWERVRLRRLLDGLASREPDAAARAVRLSPPVVRGSVAPLGGMEIFRTEFPAPRWLCPARAAVLVVALRLYQEVHGKPAERLTDLVPAYLPAVPEDPFDRQPFRYRLSRGETLGWPPADLGESDESGPRQPEAPPLRDVPAGQGILWSVGKDLQDGGGLRQESPHVAGTGNNPDWIFLVPLPAGR